MDSPDNMNDAFQRKLQSRAAAARKFSLLVVDDEPSMLELLKTALTALGNYDVSIASSAEKALRTIERRERPFDCFLLDIQMPQTNGIQLLEQIREIPECADTPAIMLTAMSDRDYVDQAFLAGATDYVTKPFDLLQLRSRLTSAHNLVEERKKVRKSVEDAHKLRDELAYNQQFSLDDPITIEGADRYLRYAEFDNYIMQLSRGRLFNSHARAIKLQDAEFIFDTKSCGDFRRVLQDIAIGISKLTKDISSMLSYRGNGVFLAVTHGRGPAAAFPDEIALNQIVETLMAQRQSDAWANVLISENIPLRSLSKTGAIAALNSAIENVEQREAALQDALEKPNKIGEHALGPSQSHSRKRVYERVLRQLFKEEASLEVK